MEDFACQVKCKVPTTEISARPASSVLRCCSNGLLLPLRPPHLCNVQAPQLQGQVQRRVEQVGVRGVQAGEPAGQGRCNGLVW